MPLCAVLDECVAADYTHIGLGRLCYEICGLVFQDRLHALAVHGLSPKVPIDRHSQFIFHFSSRACEVKAFDFDLEY